jgi:bifunctional pyridoxal-dependent enzyme with beta-cystathionase and maltose regulon repressor activities
MDIAELQRALDEAKKYCIPRAIVVINPGNPTGMLRTCLFLNLLPLYSDCILLVPSLKTRICN